MNIPIRINKKMKNQIIKDKKSDEFLRVIPYYEGIFS
jgi:hypothetical protein